MRTTQRVIYVDSKTGEVLGVEDNRDIFVQTAEQREAARRWVKKKIALKEFGDFVWLFYSMCEKAFLPLHPSDIARLFMIATYLGYDGYLEQAGGKPIGKKYLREILHISYTQFYSTWNALLENGFIREDNGKIFLDGHYFRKGSLKKAQKDNVLTKEKSLMCLNVAAIRKLYRQADSYSHKPIGHFFQMIPYLNRYYNVLCWNPGEDDYDLIKPMKAPDFCGLIGHRRSTASRLFDSLSQFIIPGVNEPVFVVTDGRITNKTGCPTGKKRKDEKIRRQIVVNPALFYADCDWKEIVPLFERGRQ